MPGAEIWDLSILVALCVCFTTAMLLIAVMYHWAEYYTHNMFSVRLKWETSKQALKTDFSRDYLINTFLYNTNIFFT